MYDPIWDSIFSSRAWGRYPAEELIRFVMRESSRFRDKALELGCGPGANLCFLANEGIRFDAIDGSSSAVAQAKMRLDSESPGWKGRIEVGNFCVMPSDFNEYDFVLDSEAIYCNDFEESKNLISDIFEKLVPGGAFWSRTFAPGTWGVESGKLIGRDYWIANEGPMVNKGQTRLTRLESLPELYGAGWDTINVGELIIVARKPN